MHYTQKILAGLALSALSAGGFIGLEAALQGAAAQTVSNARNVRSATNPQGHTVNSWSSARGGTNCAPLSAADARCDAVCRCKRKCPPNAPFCDLDCAYTGGKGGYPSNDEPKLCSLSDPDYWGCVQKYWEKKLKQQK